MKPKPIYEIVTTTKKVRVGWRCRCIACGQLFTSKRSDAACCSNRCRAAVSYQRRNG